MLVGWKYSVKFAMDLKMLRHNTRARSMERVYHSFIFLKLTCLAVGSSSSGRLLGVQNVWPQLDLPIRIYILMEITGNSYAHSSSRNTSHETIKYFTDGSSLRKI